jgi:NAD(P)-dependent dehydrogenase (short-subunit alcohol dehydrogenase family)
MVTTLFADRLAEYGIHVYEIRPGIIATDMTAGVKEKYDRRILEEGILPIRRWGTPEDVAGAVSVLCSGKLSYATGEILNIDGGFHLRRL